MSNAANLAIIIDDYLNQLTAIEIAADAGNLSAQATQVKLSITIASLITVYRVKATEEINISIGKNSPGFEYFNGTNPNLSYNRLKEIYEAVLGDDGVSGCRTPTNPDADLACLVQLIVNNNIAEIDEAVKQRIILEVQAIMPSYDPDDIDLAPIILASNARQLYDGNSNTTLGIPFKYNRQAVATFGINRAISNFANFPVDGDGLALNEPFHGSVGSSRNYSRIITHRGGLTGSSTFISECLADGGHIPMTLPPVSAACVDLEDAPTGTYASNPWKVCPAIEENVSYGSAVRNWKDHNGIREYFAASASYKIITPSQVDEYIHTSDFLGEGLAGTLKQGAETGLANLFSDYTVKLGDYIFVGLYDGGQGQPSDHGFLIIGWGPIVDVLDSFTNPLTPASTRSSSNPVPYVVDFCFGTGDTSNADNTGWLQDPRPRPFYASAVEMGDSRLNNLSNEIRDKLRNRYYAPFVISGTRRPNWEFCHIPDIISVAFTRIYVEPQS
jgi:hypothetical protein